MAKRLYTRTTITTTGTTITTTGQRLRLQDNNYDYNYDYDNRDYGGRRQQGQQGLRLGPREPHQWGNMNQVHAYEYRSAGYMVQFTHLALFLVLAF